MKKIIVFLLIFSTIFLLSCDFDKAQAYGNDFCYALAQSNDAAKEYLHPSSKLNGDRFENFVNKLEEFNEIDFSSGIEVKGSSFSASSYRYDVNGYHYEYIYEVTINGKTVKMFCIIIDDVHGYGIYSFGIIE